MIRIEPPHEPKRPVSTVVAVGISGAIVLGSSQLFLNIDHQNKSAEKSFWISARRSEIQGLIRNDLPWATIVAANADLACLASTTTGCTAFSAAPSPIRIPMDGSFLDGTSATQGMNAAGELCNTFDATNGNAACPTGVSLTWQALCDDAKCLRAQPKVTVKFSEKLPGSPIKQLLSYNLTAYRDPKLQSLNVTCESMGGTYTAPNCVLPLLSLQCNPAAGSFVLGFDALGAVNCGKPLLNACAADQVSLGFDAAGGLICGAACW